MARIALLFALLLSLTAGAADEDVVDHRLFEPERAERTILVTFADSGIKRLAVGPRMTRYVSRGYRGTTWARQVSSELAREYDLIPLAEWPISELGFHCIVYLVPDARSVGEAIAALDTDTRVRSVQRMGVFRTRGAAADPYLKLQNNLRDIGLDQIHRYATGDGVRIAIIDTGIDVAHPDLAGQFDARENFVATVSPSFNSDRHGTAVAGIIGAVSGNGAGIVGIAPDARMLAYKACWQAEENSLAALCNSFTLAIALNAAIRANAGVINMSLTGPYDPLLEALLTTATRRGIVVIAAETEVGPSSSRGFPSSMDVVIAVRARTGRDAVDVAAAPANVVAAPGVDILTTVPNGTYDFLSGCSFSAAQVSGLVALALQLRPTVTLSELIAALRRSDRVLGAGLLALRPPT